ncbi:hypothetical protein [Ralstonia pseudosolanacearum]|uniref:hypothetical protein n=1 Tax=Ralstonia pseudosolanacearum TaxID=1310165 RepID=UPI003CF6C21D
MIEVARAADLATPKSNNVEFLDQFIAGVTRCTGRLYGQTTYVRLLEKFEIPRRPSAQTWSKAINRARLLGIGFSGALANGVRMGETEQVASSPPLVALHTVQIESEQADELVELRARVQLAEMSSRDAYKRIKELESERKAIEFERKALLERAVTAEVAARLATEQVERERAEHISEKATLLASNNAMAKSMAEAADRFSGLERHLRLQTDAVRQEMSQQLHTLKSRAEVAEKTLAAVETQNDAMRRMLGNRAPGKNTG